MRRRTDVCLNRNREFLYYSRMRWTSRTSRLGLAVPLAVIGSCASDNACGVTDPQECSAVHATATALGGTWKTAQAPSGISLDMSLNASDMALSGAASVRSPSANADADVHGRVEWRAAFASPGGPIPAQPVVVLSLSLSTGGMARFDQGTLRADTLRGALTFLNDSTRSYGLTLVRAASP